MLRPNTVIIFLNIYNGETIGRSHKGQTKGDPSCTKASQAKKKKRSSSNRNQAWKLFGQFLITILGFLHNPHYLHADIFSVPLLNAPLLGHQPPSHRYHTCRLGRCDAT